MLRDQGSANGLVVEGASVKEVVLREGQPVRIPDPYGNLITLSLRVRAPPPQRAQGLPPPKRAGTRCL